MSTLRNGPELKQEGKEGESPLVVWKHGARQVNEFDGRRVFLEGMLEFLQRKWRLIRPDIIHAHDFDSLYLGWMLKTAFRTPLLLTLHHAPRQWRERLYQERPKTCFLEGFRSFDLLDAVVVPSEASRDVLLNQWCGVTKPRKCDLKVIPHGIGRHLASFQPDPRLMQSLNIGPDAKVLFCPTRVDVHKDVRTFVRAAARLKDNYRERNLKFIVATTPQGEDFELVSLISERLGLSEGKDIHFRQFSYPEMATVFRRADICVVPSPRESFGLTVLEAFLFGVPVVAANSAALPEIVKHGSNGLLFEFGDYEDLANRVGSLLDNPEWAETIGNEGKHTVRDGGEFSAARMVEDHESVYAEVVARNIAS